MIVDCNVKFMLNVTAIELILTILEGGTADNNLA